MGRMFLLILCGVIGYLLGSINTSVVTGKFYGVDVRQHGSGNAGATNTLRVLGKKAAIMVLIGDILKGLVTCVITNSIAGQTGAIVGGAAAIVGHNWPLYFGFKGGKGVLTSITVMFYLDWQISLILVAIFAIVVLISRYVSLGSILGAIALPVLMILFGREIKLIIFSAALAVLVVAKHHSNIKRLVNGTESKIKL
ncbi:MAG TPA: glycerol-3-phosphate 1-O-acyltransferase PlsY [Clostridiaceae bacterium]|nr:glycerol-3-phosphate 1-O-acyltransferase PlsY [Clostridiaceae bacterium]